MGDEAHQRYEKFGPNTLPDTSVHPFRRALEKFWAPVPWMLEVAIALELMLGKYVEAAIIASLLVFNAALGLLQESRAQATLAALKSRLALIASVRRDGVWEDRARRRAGAGRRREAFARLRGAADVRLTGGEILLDQSTLTGESPGALTMLAAA
jgi:H+-transporting ATPase